MKVRTRLAIACGLIATLAACKNNSPSASSAKSDDVAQTTDGAAAVNQVPQDAGTKPFEVTASFPLKGGKMALKTMITLTMPQISVDYNLFTSGRNVSTVLLRADPALCNATACTFSDPEESVSLTFSAINAERIVLTAVNWQGEQVVGDAIFTATHTASDNISCDLALGSGC